MPLTGGGLISSVRIDDGSVGSAGASASTGAIAGTTLAGLVAGSVGGALSSTLQQRRQTGNSSWSSSFLRRSTYFSLFQTSPSVWVVRSPTSTRMNGQKNTLPLNDTRACMNG